MLLPIINHQPSVTTSIIFQPRLPNAVNTAIISNSIFHFQFIKWSEWWRMMWRKNPIPFVKRTIFFCSVSLFSFLFYLEQIFARTQFFCLCVCVCRCRFVWDNRQLVFILWSANWLLAAIFSCVRQISNRCTVFTLVPYSFFSFIESYPICGMKSLCHQVTTRKWNNKKNVLNMKWKWKTDTNAYRLRMVNIEHESES